MCPRRKKEKKDEISQKCIPLPRSDHAVWYFHAPKFRSLKHKIIQQSLENAGNFLSIFCILCMALYGFV